jgi:hypothetical protein
MAGDTALAMRHRPNHKQVVVGLAMAEADIPASDPSGKDHAVRDGEECQPFWGHCADCGHEWVIFYAPIDLSKVGEIGKRAICPSCASTKVNCGKAQ